MIRTIKQFTAVLTLIAVFLLQIPHVRAFEPPVAPTAPPAPSVSTTEEVASAQNAPSVQETVSEPPPPPSAPTPPTTPILQEATPPIPSTPTLDEEEDDVTTPGDVDSSDQEEGGSYETVPQDSLGNTQDAASSPLVGIAENGQVGEVTIQTGDASTNGLIVSTGNVNSTGAGGNAGDSVSVANSENGESSDNSGSASIINNTDTLQNNQADVGNTLSQSTVSGQNSASQNVGNSTIVSGDANTSGTVITAVNTNVDGVAVSEFTIADDHIGDIVLDFASSCISGCGEASSAVAKNVENGANSDNVAHIDETSNTNTFQANDATVENTLTLASDSGNNTASENTNGNSTIETGDANVVGNVLNFVNNNLAGNVVFGVVNIFGDLVGDIILPEEALSSCASCDSPTTVAANIGNGADSSNTALVSQTDNNTIFQSNDATIENNLILSANTGDNKASQNTGGSTEITTGDSTVDAQVLNVANSNVNGGDWWLVLVNEAGRWVGRILGAPEGANYAGSQGTEFVVNENGEITAVNSGNGASSQNTASVSQTTNTTTVQTNNAHVVNNIALSANTGGNSASQNTGGNSSITTGDAHVIANLVNFVNNNVTGGGKLVVTVVNVFGSWIGDFVTPGTQKTKEVAVDATPPVGAGPQSIASSGTPSGNNGATNPSPSNSQQSSPSVGGNSGVNNTGSSAQNQNSAVPSTNPVSTNASSSSSSVPVAQRGASTFIASVDGESSDEILGAITGEDSSGPKKQITVNLAWFALFIPLVLALILVKKKALLKRILPQRFTN